MIFPLHFFALKTSKEITLTNKFILISSNAESKTMTKFLKKMIVNLEVTHVFHLEIS